MLVGLFLCFSFCWSPWLPLWKNAFRLNSVQASSDLILSNLTPVSNSTRQIFTPPRCWWTSSPFLSVAGCQGWWQSQSSSIWQAPVSLHLALDRLIRAVHRICTDACIDLLHFYPAFPPVSSKWCARPFFSPIYLHSSSVGLVPLRQNDWLMVTWWLLSLSGELTLDRPNPSLIRT